MYVNNCSQIFTSSSSLIHALAFQPHWSSFLVHGYLTIMKKNKQFSVLKKVVKLVVNNMWCLFCMFCATLSDEAGGTSEDELSWEKMEAVEGHESSGTRPGDQELKEMLLRKYGGYLSSLRKEFLKKRKKGKLPKEARRILLDWWTTHYRWPYPTVIQININTVFFVLFDR